MELKMNQMPNEETRVKLEINVNELNAILQGLLEIKLGAALSAWTTINKQAEQQLGKPQVAPQGPLSNKIIN